MLEQLIESIVGLTKTDTRQFIVGLKDEEGQYKEDMPDQLKSLLVNHIKTVGEDQMKRGVRVKGSELDKYTREKLGADYSLPKDATDKELIDALAEAMNAERQKLTDATKTIDAGKELTVEEIMARPEIRERMAASVSEATKDLNAKLEEQGKAHKADIAERDTKRKAMKLNSYIDNLITELNVPVDVEGNEGLSKARRKAIRGVINVNEVVENEKGELLLVDENGDERYHPTTHAKMTLKDYFQEVNFLGTEKMKPDVNSTPKPPGGGSHQAAYKFADGEAFQKALKAETDPAKKASMSNDYIAQVKAAQG